MAFPGHTHILCVGCLFCISSPGLLSVVVMCHSHTHLCFQQPRSALIIANRAECGEMVRETTFHLGLYCLPKYLFMEFQYT